MHTAPRHIPSRLAVRIAAAVIALSTCTATLADDCLRPGFLVRGKGGFASALARLGDLDGDGVSEIAASSPGDGVHPGAVHVLRGSTLKRLFSIAEDGAGGGFGFALASLGTTTAGDPPVASSRLAVGAPCTNGSRGRAIVYDVTATGAKEAFRIDGADGEGLGVALSEVAGNKIGLVIGAPGSSQGPTRAGRVLVVDPDGTVRSTPEGERPFEGYGWAVADAGDVDGDGIHEFVAGSRDTRPGGEHRGRVTVRRRDGTLLLRLDGAMDELLGGALAGPGDLDGDGFDDFVAGAIGAPPRLPCNPAQIDQPMAGKVYVFRGGAAPVTAGGTLGQLLRTMTGDVPGALFGTSVTALDDLDGDGAREIAVGAPFAADTHGQRAGQVQVLDGRDGSRLWTFDGLQGNDRLGYAILGAGDLDGDGIGDLLASRLRQDGELAFFPLGDANGNGVRDACESCAAPVDLALGTAVELRSTRLARRHCFRFDSPRGAALRLRLGSDSTDHRAFLLFLRWGAPPEPDSFDLRATGAGAADPGLIVPVAPGEKGYVTVLGGISDEDTLMHLLVEVLPLPALLEMSPSRSAAGASSPVQAAIRGAGIPQSAVFALRPAGGGAPIPATETTWLSAARVDASFALEGAQPAMYDLVAFQAGVESAVLPRAFEVTAGNLGEAYRVTLSGPQTYRNHTLARLTLRVANLGDRPLPPPLVQVAGPPGASLSFARDTAAVSGAPLGIVRSSRTADGSLPPGSMVSVPVWFHREVAPDECAPAAGDCPLAFEVRFFEPLPPVALDWSTQPVPDGMTEEDWRRVVPVLSGLGSTWTGYHMGLVDLAGQRSRRGQNAHSALYPFQLGVRRALGLPPAAITGVVRNREHGLPGRDAIVVAMMGDQPMAFAPTNDDGYYVLDWVESGGTYRLEVVTDPGHAVLDSDPLEVHVPDAGDLHGVDIVVGPAVDGRVITPACPPCDAAALPTAPLVPPPETFTRRAGFTTQVISAFDPNEKNGSGTQGGDTEIDPAEAIEYRVYFENLGGAAANTVLVVDELPPELDWQTVELRDVYIGTTPDPIVVTLGGDEGSAAPGGTQDFSGASGLPVDPSSIAPSGDGLSASARWRGQVEYEYGNTDRIPVSLAIHASVEPAAEASIEGAEQGVVTWILDGTIPGNPDASAGFLPYGCPEAPEDAPPDASTACGGHVSFVVRPGAAAADGSVVTNDAEITFDNLPPKVTDPAATVTITPQPPGAPSFPTPPESSQGSAPVSPAGIRLTWQAEYADTFDLYLWSSAQGNARPGSPGETAVWQEGLISPQYPAGEDVLVLPAGGDWLWQVVSHNARGESTEGPVWSFSTRSATEQLFRRADVDRSGDVSITDAISGLTFLFLGGEVPACLDALDADNSGEANITDPILILTYLFLGGANIPAPGATDCGPDTGSSLGCADYGACN